MKTFTQAPKATQAAEKQENMQQTICAIIQDHRTNNPMAQHIPKTIPQTVLRIFPTDIPKIIERTLGNQTSQWNTHHLIR